jgi:hypothetical protein
MHGKASLPPSYVRRAEEGVARGTHPTGRQRRVPHVVPVSCRKVGGSPFGPIRAPLSKLDCLQRPLPKTSQHARVEDIVLIFHFLA